MAVDKYDEVFHPTDGLILGASRRQYLTTLSPIHWQLRSLVGTEQNVVYFPGGAGNLHIQKLNTATHEIETIKILNFSPQCLVSQNGWLCCGGEHGEFAAIRLAEGDDSASAGAGVGLDLDADPPLPLELEARRDESLWSLFSRARNGSSNNNNNNSNNNGQKTLIAKSTTFGEDRVNCITLWCPPTVVNSTPGAYEQAVAVLANNDKTVTVVSLRDTVALSEVSYPDCVNRALLSPDGRLLIAVCDDPYLYVHERVEKWFEGSRSTENASYEWRLCSKTHLKSQRRDDRTDNKGSFAACFNSTGRYLAVGTQYGIISVFDSRGFTDPDVDSLVTTFASSRPGQKVGAVRDLAFSPGPYDLLAWTEDRGVVGVADVRTRFIARQILDLRQKGEYAQVDVSSKSTADAPRSDSAADRIESGPTGAGSISSLLDQSSEARRSSRRSELLDRLYYPLTSDETLILEALQEHRRRREQREREQRNSQPPTGPTRRLAEPSATRSTLATENSARSSRERSSSMGRTVNDIIGSLREDRERLREIEQRRNRVIQGLNEHQDSEHRRVNLLPPRRAHGAGGRAADSGLPGSARDSIARIMRNWPPQSSSGGWSDLETLYNVSNEGVDTLRTGDGTLSFDRPPRANDWEPTQPLMGGRRPIATYFARDQRPEPEDTAGLAWSEDGRVLYVGAEDGIYEFHVNIHGRKMFAAIEMR